jgi:hypothetical protein
MIGSTSAAGSGGGASMGIIVAIIGILLFLLNSSSSSSSSKKKSITASAPVIQQALSAIPVPTFTVRSTELKKKEVTCDECLNRTGNACLADHFDNKNKRSISWTDLFIRLGEHIAKIQNIIELGTSHLGEKSCIDTGCSTVLFGQWVKNRNEMFADSKSVPQAKLYSVDENEAKIQASKAIYGKYPLVSKHIEFVHSNPRDFIINFQKPIDLLYIDSSKLSDPQLELEEVKRMHLAEIRSAIPKLSKHALVVIDNVNSGQGDMVIQELSAKGFRILMDDFQVILCKPVMSDAAKNEISIKSEWMADSSSSSSSSSSTSSGNNS